MPFESTPLFGGPLPWSPLDWRPTDDRVRGGSSQSYMTCHPGSPLARFEGTLDTTTLGGAGFASQRTATEQTWDLSGWEGVVLDIQGGDGKRYTFNLKDSTPPPASPSTSAQENSSLSWEFDFTPPATPTTVLVPFSALVPTYRGRKQSLGKGFDAGEVRQMSFMMRSFFDKQAGPFGLSIRAVGAYRDGESRERYRDDPSGAVVEREWSEKGAVQDGGSGVLGWVFGWCTRGVRLR